MILSIKIIKKTKITKNSKITNPRALTTKFAKTKVHLVAMLQVLIRLMFLFS